MTADTIDTRLTIKNFAQIEQVDLQFGDVTVLVGAQGTGKSIALQWLKTAMDGRQIVSALETAGQQSRKPEVLIDLIFGVGMHSAWLKGSEIIFNGKKLPCRYWKDRQWYRASLFHPRASRDVDQRWLGSAVSKADF
jgi:hypothetical protein